MKTKAEVIKNLSTCPIVQVACQKSGISRATYYRWRKEDSGFKNRSDNAMKTGTRFINDLAESQAISLIKDKNPTMIIYWLKHHHPRYTDRQLILSTSEQDRLIKVVTSKDYKSAYQQLTTSVVSGKISRFFFNSFVSIINRVSKTRKTNGEDKKYELLYKLRG